MKVLIPGLLLAFSLAACGTTAPDAVASGADPSLNERFRDPELDVAEFVDRFEGESREIAVNRGALMKRLNIQAGELVADIGTGTGLFLEPLSRAVGPEGRLWAVDISEGFLDFVGERIEREGLDNVRPVLCDARSTKLPPASIDVAFICDTYHHFEYPADTLASLHAALKPGGRLFVVDFERIPGVSSDWILGHVRAGKEVFKAEIEAAGFGFAVEYDVPGLEENYVLGFYRDS